MRRVEGPQWVDSRPSLPRELRTASYCSWWARRLRTNQSASGVGAAGNGRRASLDAIVLLPEGHARVTQRDEASVGDRDAVRVAR
jgi:hypothetical protein